MTQNDYREICETIGYTFNNPYLLEQAFIRKSYSEENPGVENNEVLEFLGDKVLDYVIVWNMASPEWYGSMTAKRQFHSKFDEGKLTTIKTNLVDKEILSKRIDILDLSKYLIMGKGDIQNNVQNDTSVKEDLFEAIVGAVAIDSHWDPIVLKNLINKMLNPTLYLNQGYDKDFNYCGQLQDWCQKRNIPLEFNYEAIEPQTLMDTVMQMLNGSINLNSFYGYRCSVNLFKHKFIGQGQSKASARMAVSKLILDFIKKNNLDAEPEKAEEKKEIKEDDAIQHLNMLYQKKRIAQPLYEFEEKRTKEGKAYWSVKLSIPQIDPYFYGDFSSKKEGKKKLALAMLKKLPELGVDTTI